MPTVAAPSGVNDLTRAPVYVLDIYLTWASCTFVFELYVSVLPSPALSFLTYGVCKEPETMETPGAPRTGVLGFWCHRCALGWLTLRGCPRPGGAH